VSEPDICLFIAFLTEKTALRDYTLSGVNAAISQQLQIWNFNLLGRHRPCV